MQSPSAGLQIVSQERDYEKIKRKKKVAPRGHRNTFQNGIQVLLGFNQLSALHSDSFRLPSWTLLYHYSPPKTIRSAMSSVTIDFTLLHLALLPVICGCQPWSEAVIFSNGRTFWQAETCLVAEKLKKMILPNSSHHIPGWDNRATHNMEWSHYYFSRKLSGLSHTCSGSGSPWTLLASLFVNMWVIEPQSQKIQCICLQFAAVNTAPSRIPKAPHAFRVVRVKLRSNHLCSAIDSP